MVRHPVDFYKEFQKILEKYYENLKICSAVSSVCFSLNAGSSEVLIEGDLVFPKTRNALYCFNNNCFWKKNSNNVVEIPYIVSREFCE